LVHELGHTVAAHRFGIGVRRIRLVAWGGLAELESAPSKPTASLTVAAAGPAGSALCAAVFAALAAVTPAGSSMDVSFRFLAYANTAMTVLNLIPGNPLDGGRVLSAMVWGLTGSRSTGESAVRVGGWLSAGVLFGLAWAASRGVINIQIGPIWLVYVGAMLVAFSMAPTEVATARNRRSGAGPRTESVDVAPLADLGPVGQVPVGQMAEPIAATVSAHAPISEVFQRAGVSGFAVLVDSTGGLVGVVPLDWAASQLRARAAAAGAAFGSTAQLDVPSAEVALPIAALAAATPNEPLAVVEPRRAASASGLVLVMLAGRAQGIWRGQLPR
jgi:Zn-dependent protease